MADSVLDIAIGVIGGKGGPFLMEVRQPDQHLGGMLAFPGGKFEAGESPQEALRREILEEVGLEPTASQSLITIPWQDAERNLRLHVYRITDWRGQPHGREGQELRLCPLSTLWAETFPPANRGILLALALPTLMVVSAACADGEQGFAAWLADLAATLRPLSPDSVLVQLRPGRALSADEWQQALAVVSAAGMTALTNREGRAELVPVDAGTPGLVGVHLSSDTLMQLDSIEALRPGRVTAAVHDATQIAQANRLCVDAVVLSPVRVTRSHPEVEPLGWSKFAELAAQAQMPVYGLGGLSVSDVSRIVEAGGQGIAAIGAFWQSGAGK